MSFRNSADQMQREYTEEVESNYLEPIAIVGMGCRLPGGVSNPLELWDLLMSKKTGLREFGPDRINIEGYYHPNSNRPGSLHTRAANLLDEDPRLFDHAFFGLRTSEVRSMDPSQRKILEVAYEAFESAGEPWEKFSGSRTGVYIGNFNTDYHTNQTYDVDFAIPYTATGGSASIISNRINYVFNLRGPSVTVDTACSSSMYALHLAVSALRNGDCDAAIVGGSNLILSPEMQMTTKSFGALSATSTCHTFDALADGYGRGEGFGALYLKRHSEAIKEIYPIRALLRQTAVNSNGRTAGISHPGVEGQEALMQQAYHSAGLSPRDTGYFECHGTGTPVGDPVEVTAIGKVFATHRETPLLIGSVKSNLGHSESASAITGVIKCVLALEKGLIPPTVGLETLNPNIDFKAARVEVVTEVKSWPKETLKRASVNSFGYGGANGHCILDHPENIGTERKNIVRKDLAHGAQVDAEICLDGQVVLESAITKTDMPQMKNDPSKWNGESTMSIISGSLSGLDLVDHALTRIKSTNPSPKERPIPTTVTDGTSQRSLFLLSFSGHDEAALQNNMRVMRSGIGRFPLPDIAYTLSRRSKFLFKSHCIVNARNPEQTFRPEEAETQRPLGPQAPRISFIFNGQGAQWQNMGRTLFVFAEFRASITAQEQILCSLSSKPSWSVADILAGKSDLLVSSTEISQTVCTALQIGLVDLLDSWNITPTAVIGHSSGEIAAAYAAGYMSRAEAIVTAYCRGKAIAQSQTTGKMMAVGISVKDCQALLLGREESVKVAAINSPSSVTLSGDTDIIDQLHHQIQAQGTFARILDTGGNAYHSHHMKNIGEKYQSILGQSLDELRLQNDDERDKIFSQKHWYSTVRAEIGIDSGFASLSYWRRNLESCVNFSQAVTEMLGRDSLSRVDVLLEVGPHSTLQGPLKQILASLELEPGFKAPVYAPTCKRFNDGELDLLGVCASLSGWGYPVDISRVNSVERMSDRNVQYEHGLFRPELPSYQYNYGPISCHETRISREIRQRKFLRHDLLGVLQPGCARDRPSWRNILRLNDVPWLKDHRLNPNIVFPASGYVCLAIEALSQYLCKKPEMLKDHCFQLRNIAVESALRVPEDDMGVEIVLNLQASSTSPVWFDFRLSSVSRDGCTWTDHASGLVSVSERTASPKRIANLDFNQRSIDVSDWYTNFSRAGLGYGPSFQQLRDLKCDPYHNTARAKVGMKTTGAYFAKGPESAYLIHPSSLDLCHQLALISCHGGQTERFQTAFVPVSIDEMMVWPDNSGQDNWGHGAAIGQLKGLRGALANVQLYGESGAPRVNIKNLRCVSYHGGDEKISEPEAHEYSRLVWKPDAVTLSQEQAKKLFPPPVDRDTIAVTFARMDELAACIILDIHERFGHLVMDQPRLHIYLRWIARSATSDVCSDELRAKSITERHAIIDGICNTLSDVIDVQLARQMFDGMADILSGAKTSIEVAVQNGMLAQVYSSGLGISAAYPQLGRLLDLLSHRDPGMKIMEVGAGTGGATAAALSVLAPENSPKRYDSYWFTDISSVFLASAKIKFASFRGMKYKIFNLNNDLEDHDMLSQQDVIIASECLHAAQNIPQSLRRLRKLLKPGGKLVLLETTRSILGHNLIYGTFPDWWSEDEDRFSPFLTSSEWHQTLQMSGFSGVDIELKDYEEPFGIVSTILTTAVVEESVIQSTHIPEKVHIIYSDHITSFHQRIAEELRRVNRFPAMCHLRDSDLPQGSRAIICDIEQNNNLADIDEQGFMHLKAIIRQASSVLWLNIGDALCGRFPRSAITTGLVRMLTTEMPEARHGIFMLEHTPDVETDASLVANIIHREGLIHNGDLDREIAVKDDIVYISRLYFDAELNKRHRALHKTTLEPTPLPVHEHGPLIADFWKPGLVTSLFFREDESFIHRLPNDYVEIKTAAVGMNWKDLAACTGKLDLDYFSAESSGTIVKLGSAVRDLCIGDRVYALVGGKYGNISRLPAKMVQVMRPADRFEEMASVPLVFCSAHYGLNHLARLQKGETVLIQGATGGVGLAALQLAKHIGAKVYATVGRKAKVQYLIDQCGIERTRIFSTRDETDIERMVEATSGRGFDVILSATSGNMMHEIWRQIAPRGRFIDIGRQDVQNCTTLAMEVFQRNAVYASFDIGIMALQDMDFCARLMREVGDMIKDEVIRPIFPLKTLDVSELSDALLYFSQGKHIGKVVVTYSDQKSLVPMIPPSSSVRFDPSSLYIVVGGLGGFGVGILEWMVSRGAQNLAIWSRSEIAPAGAQSFLSDLKRREINILMVRCDITDKASVEAAMVKTSAQSYPVKGLLHAAVTFCDQVFETLPCSQWKLGLSAKVMGTENLHETTVKHNLDLDFFVMTSSYQAVVALPTQAAYCAANSFQDAFARHRRSLGLPACAIALGLITEIGKVGQRDVTRAMVNRNNLYGTGEFKALRLLEAAFLDAPQTKIHPENKFPRWNDFDPLAEAQITTCLEPWRLAQILKKNATAHGTPRWMTDKKFCHLIQAIEDHNSHSDRATQVKRIVPAATHYVDAAIQEGRLDDARGLVTQSIKERIASLLQIPIEGIEAGRSVARYGVDSLIAVEFRSWLTFTFQSTIPLLVILDEVTAISILSNCIIKERRGRLHV